MGKVLSVILIDERGQAVKGFLGKAIKLENSSSFLQDSKFVFSGNWN
jgi:hypothetical protein